MEMLRPRSSILRFLRHGLTLFNLVLLFPERVLKPVLPILNQRHGGYVEARDLFHCISFSSTTADIVNVTQLLPSARNALQRVEHARVTGIIHTNVWVRELNAYAPETTTELERTFGGRLRVHSYLQAEEVRAPVLYMPSPNPYAMALEEFSGAARYAAEALQRGVHLVDPHCSITDLTANLSSISSRGATLLVEGHIAMIKAVGVLDTDVAAHVPALICIHPGDVPNPRSVPVYRVDENLGAAGWAGMPSTPLAIARWIPEVCTYLDAIRPWLDLRCQSV